MNLLNKKFLIFSAVVSLAFFLRIFNYTSFPVGGETADESAWAFLGSSLIQEKQPTSWSYFGAYQNGYIYKERVNNAPLVRPALDHPPLFSLLPGFAHTLKNNWQDFPSIKLIRLPMVFLGTINVGLLFVLASKYFKKTKWVYLSSIIYATAPSFVFASRLVVAENLLVTWTLLSLILLRPEKWKFKYVALLLVGVLAVLTKVSGIVIPISIFVYGFSIKDKKIIMSGLWGLIIGVIAFSMYGAYFNWHIFTAILFDQAGRDLGLATFYNRFLIHPGVVEKIFFDGWILVGLISVILSIYKNKKTFHALNLFVIFNLLFIIATSGEQTFHAWYDYMLYPLFVIAIVDNIKTISKKHNYLMFGLIWILFLPLIRMGAVHANWYHHLSPFILRAIMGLGFIPFLLSLFSKKINKKWIILSLWLLLFLSYLSLTSVSTI